MKSVPLTDEEITYLLALLAKQRFALARYLAMKGSEEKAEQELVLVCALSEKLAASTDRPSC